MDPGKLTSHIRHTHQISLHSGHHGILVQRLRWPSHLTSPLISALCAVSSTPLPIREGSPVPLTLVLAVMWAPSVKSCSGRGTIQLKTRFKFKYRRDGSSMNQRTPTRLVSSLR